jgi:hypothetical protein
MTPEIAARISTAKMGHAVSSETREKISAAFRGRRQSPEAIAARAAANTRHGYGRRGENRLPEYRAWDAMKQRCLNPGARRYEDYGGAGITVCAWWRSSFEHFLADVGDKPEPKSRYSLDRPDGMTGYWCGHCDECVRLGRPRNGKWSTRSEQQKNRPGFSPDKARKCGPGCACGKHRRT